MGSVPYALSRSLWDAAWLRVPSIWRDVRLHVFFLFLVLAPENGVFSNSLWSLSAFLTGSKGTLRWPQCFVLQVSSRIAWSWPQRCFWIKWCKRSQIKFQRVPALGLLLHSSLLRVALWLCNYRMPSTTAVTPISPRSTRKWAFSVSKQ